MVNTPLHAQDFAFYNRPQYFAKLVELCDQSGKGDRILVASMNFEPSHIPKVVPALAAASKRGADVSLVFDAYAITYANRGETRIGAFWWPGVDPKHQGKKHRMITDAMAFLRQNGVHCIVTNQPQHKISTPFAGRSHIKTAIFNDLVFVGGINLHKPGSADEMLSFRHAPTADWLYKHMHKLLDNPYTLQAFGAKDLAFSVDKRTELLLDVGVRGQSVILQNALNVIDGAQKWLVITCQYFPNGETAQALKRAYDRGVAVHVVYSPALHHGLVEAPAQFMSEYRERMRMPHELFALQLSQDQPFMHAKVLASEHEAIVGSHNYIRAGVSFGTAELALRREDSAFARRAALYILDQVQLGSVLS